MGIMNLQPMPAALMTHPAANQPYLMSFVQYAMHAYRVVPDAGLCCVHA